MRLFYITLPHGRMRPDSYAPIACKWAGAALFAGRDANQFGEGLSILSITITSTSALVG
jgi:hypothetical protein